MKMTLGKVLNFLGLRGNTKKETFYKTLNWLTTAGLLISTIAWAWAVPNHMEKAGWIILAGTILAIPNLISWWGFCKDQCHEKKRRTWRITELVMRYGMIAVLFVSRVYLSNLGKEILWDLIFCVLILGTNAVSWHYRNKLGEHSW